MKTDFSNEEKPDLLAAAKIAQSGPEREDFWTQVAEYFDARRTVAKKLVAPRPEAETK